MRLLGIFFRIFSITLYIYQLARVFICVIVGYGDAFFIGDDIGPMSMDFTLLGKIAPESDDIAGKSQRILQTNERHADDKFATDHFAYLTGM